MSWKNPIRSEDPQAVEKLTAELEKAEKLQERMKTANKWIRKMKNQPESSLRLEGKHTIFRIGFADYRLTNNNANIKRLKDRIASVSKNQAREEKETVYLGGMLTVKENPDIQRVQLLFDKKPESSVREILKSNGWHWSPTEEAWQRLLNTGAINSAQWVINEIARMGLAPVSEGLEVCSRCGKENRIVNECGCDPNNLPTKHEFDPTCVICETGEEPGHDH